MQDQYCKNDSVFSNLTVSNVIHANKILCNELICKNLQVTGNNNTNTNNNINTTSIIITSVPETTLSWTEPNVYLFIKTIPDQSNYIELQNNNLELIDAINGKIKISSSGLYQLLFSIDTYHTLTPEVQYKFTWHINDISKESIDPITSNTLTSVDIKYSLTLVVLSRDFSGRVVRTPITSDMEYNIPISNTQYTYLNQDDIIDLRVFASDINTSQIKNIKIHILKLSTMNTG